jgi:DHA1 family bicyclomycin/chloramphenicol resistance-like MFS transporter
MSSKHFSVQQPNDQQAVLKPAVLGNEQVEIENNPPSPRIRVRHVRILGGLTAFGPLSTDMYLPSLPTVSHDLGATMSQTQMTLTAAILGLSLGQVISGPLSDARGRRLPLIIGIALYSLTSLLCIVAPSVAILSILRFVQGLAGAAGVVIALAIARDLYAGTALARCISLLMMVNFLAPVLAPVLGGQLLTFASWHGVFVALAGIGAVSLLAVTFGIAALVTFIIFCRPSFIP